MSLALGVSAIGCSSGSDNSGAANSNETVSTINEVETTTSTTLPPRPPEVRVIERARAEVGQIFSDAIVASDPNGDLVTVEVSPGAPDGFSTVVSPRGLVVGFEWRPTRAGEWTVDVTATDDGGLSTTAELTLVSRHPRDVDLLVAMGDSVAAGFGRDRSDFAGSDECFRSEGDAYGALVAQQLVDAGALGPDAETMIVACAGATANSLRGVLVNPTNENGESLGESDSQLDLAVRANPTIVTLTVGSTDVSLFDAQAITRPDAGQDPVLARDPFLVDRGIESLHSGLGLALDRLVRSTDAHIVVTTWYDPTAPSPTGVEGCDDECFVDVMAGVVQDLNAAIEDVVLAQPPGRVSLARLDGEADRFSASNGFGPDALRDLGPLQGFVDTFTGGSSATCAADGRPQVEWISTLDCAHPNGDGHREIARIVAQKLLEL